MDKIKIIIEIPKDSNVKYEMRNGAIEVDRVLKVKYPFNYGFIPGTLWDDGDALDAIVIGNFSLYPGVQLYAKPIALINMRDCGVSDDKLVCSLNGEKISDYWEVIKGFLRTYKNNVEVRGYTEDMNKIRGNIDYAIQCWRQKKE